MKGFTIIELLIVLAVIAALISTMVPVGVRAVKQAHSTTVALNLSKLSEAAMEEFYLEHNASVTIEDLKPYFNVNQRKILKNYEVKNSSDCIYIWYKGGDVNASMVSQVFSAVVATDGSKPMVTLKVKKYW